MKHITRILAGVALATLLAALADQAADEPAVVAAAGNRPL
jgi:hypothetical protein